MSCSFFTYVHRFFVTAIENGMKVNIDYAIPQNETTDDHANLLNDHLKSGTATPDEMLEAFKLTLTTSFNHSNSTEKIAAILDSIDKHGPSSVSGVNFGSNRALRTSPSDSAIASIVPNFKRYVLNDIQRELLNDEIETNKKLLRSTMSSRMEVAWSGFANFFFGSGYSIPDEKMANTDNDIHDTNYDWIEDIELFRLYDINTFITIVELAMNGYLDDNAIDRYFLRFTDKKNIEAFEKSAIAFLTKSIGNEMFYAKLDDFIQRFENDVLKGVDIKEKVRMLSSNKDAFIFWPFVNYNVNRKYMNWNDGYKSYSRSDNDNTLHYYDNNCIMIEYTPKKKLSTPEMEAICKNGNEFIGLNELKFTNEKEWNDFFEKEIAIPQPQLSISNQLAVNSKKLPSFVRCCIDKNADMYAYKFSKSNNNKLVLVIPLSWQGVCYNPNCVASYLPEMA